MIPDNPDTGLPDIRMCFKGFHCCNRLYAIYNYYPEKVTTRVCIVRPGGIVRYKNMMGYRKLVCSILEIVRELAYEEIQDGLEKEQKTYEDKGFVAMRISHIISCLEQTKEEREKRLMNYRINFGVSVK